MKILVIGDFHGKFPKKFKDIIKKNKIDLILSNGDYLPFHYRKLWFKHCYGTDVFLWEVIGKKKYLELVKKDLKMGEGAIKSLNNCGVPVITVLGNIDYPNHDDLSDRKTSRKSSKKISWNYAKKEYLKVANLLKKYKNIQRVDYNSTRFGDFVFIGGRGHSAPGDVKSKGYKKHRDILEELFKKFRKENKQRRVIFLTHNVPYNTKLDLIKHGIQKGKHFGNKMFRRIIDKHQPILHVGGHIHESCGTQKLGKTLCINSGAVHEGKGAIVELEIVEGKGRIKNVKMLR